MAIVQKMKCTKCAKEFETPIELYDGTWVCPYCMKELTMTEFTVNDENHSLFLLSQTYFFHYLSEMKKILEKSVITPKDKELLDDYKEKAVSYCRDAALKGHPEARVKLGYYWEIGFIDRGGRAEGYEMAYHYYNNVCEASCENGINVEKLTQESSKLFDYSRYRSDEKMNKLAEIKAEAVMRLVRMLKENSQMLGGADKDSRYNYSANVERLKKKGLLGTDYVVRTAGTEELSDEAVCDMIYTTMESCLKGVGKAHIFGYFRVNVGTLEKLYGATEMDEDAATLKNLMQREGRNFKIALFYGKLNDKGVIDVNDYYDTIKGVGDNGVDEKLFIDGEAETDPAFLFFVLTGKVSDKYGYNKTVNKILDKVRKSLLDEAAYADGMLPRWMELFNEDRLSSKRVFCTDDVYYAWKTYEKDKKGEESPVDVLRKRVVKRED